MTKFDDNWNPIRLVILLKKLVNTEIINNTNEENIQIKEYLKDIFCFLTKFKVLKNKKIEITSNNIFN